MNALLSRIWAIELFTAAAYSGEVRSNLRPWICLQCRAKRGQRRSYRQRRALAQETVQQPSPAQPPYGDFTVPPIYSHQTNGSGGVSPIERKESKLRDGQELEIEGNDEGLPPIRRYRDRHWHSELGAYYGASPANSGVQLEVTDIRKELAVGLRLRDAERTLTAFTAASRNPEYISTVSPATLTEILKVVASDESITKLAQVYQGLSPIQADILRVWPIEDVMERYLHDIKDLASARRAVGMPLNVVDYTRLLRCAEFAGSGVAADGIWNDMQTDEVVPNVYCYNHYLGAKVNNGRHHSRRYGRNRVIPFNILARKHEKLGVPYQDYRVGIGGIKQQCVAIFNDMVSKGVVADETTFRWVMRAMAAEGDLRNVNSVLRRMWNVNVLDLMSKPNSLLPPVKTYPPSSPFYPSPKILLDLAEIYGSNNQIATAMRVVDYFSRHYKLPITHAVWERLFNWTFVLSTPRSPKAKRIGAAIGQVSLHSVEYLWNTMTGPPYNIRPTMEMYHKFIKSLFRRDALKRMTLVMEEGQLLLRQLYKEYRMAQARLALAERFPTYTVSFGQTKSRLRADVKIKNLKRRKAHMYVCQWVHWLLANTKGRAGPNKAWERRAIPDLIRKWGALVPTRVSYRTSEGRLEFGIRDVSRQERRVAKEVHEGRVVTEQELDERSRVLRERMERVGRPWDSGYGRGLAIVPRN